MSNLSTQVFGDMNYLYEHIANRDAQQLNENSEHYDEEFAELVEDIFYNISYSMASEGYSANGILDFLSKTTEEDILEKYFDATISEGLVSEDYIIEQLQIIDEGIGSLFNVLGKGMGMGAKALAKGTGTALKGTGRTISVATQRAMGPNARKAVKGAVTKVKDLAKGAKAALTSPTAKKIGLGAAGLGALGAAGAIGGAIGTKMAGGGQGPSPSNAKPSPSSNDDFMKGSALAKLGGREGRIKDGEFRTMSWSQQSKDRYNKAKGASTPAPKPPAPAPSDAGRGNGSGGGAKPAPTPPKKPAPAKLGNTSFERRTPNSAELKGAQEYKAANPNAKPEDVLKAAKEAGKRQKSVDTDVAKFNKPEELNKPAPAGSALAAEQERRKAQKQTVSSSYEYDAYDLVLEYLFDNGHADTIAEAEYLMTELDESFIQSLVENYEANLLAEEVKAWVNELVEEGYDLSEYTWDDMVDYYFTENK